MALLTGQAADIYIATGAGTAMTGEACSLVTGTTYQVTLASRRLLDPSATTIVYDGATPLPASAYQLVYGTGKIVLAAAPAGAITITGKYLTASKLGQAYKWSAQCAPSLQEAAVFGDSWEVKAVTRMHGSVTLTRFYADAYFQAGLGNFFLLVLYHKQSTGQRYVCVGRMDQNQIDADSGQLIGETVSFQTHGNWDYSAT